MSGMTLIELMITVAIVAILMAIGVPSYKYVTNANRISAEVNGLLGDLQFARAEAIKEGQTVTVCSSTNGTSCNGTATAWNSGWIVFSDVNNDQTVDAGAGDTVYRMQRAFNGSDTFKADNSATAITFNREGFASVAGAAPPVTLTLRDATSNQKWTRCLAVKTILVLETQKPGTGNCS
jgi:type IV fimbrial biogenesis protein FimT